MQETIGGSGWDELRPQLDGLLSGETDPLATTANFVALLFHFLDRVNWLGLYVRRGDELVLGPFQGRPACVRIAIGDGVCGTAAARRETVSVPDVHAFPGHIACDPASRSEVVVPLMCGERLFAVLDVDSPETGRFAETDVALLEAAARRLEAVLGERALSL